MRHLLIIGLAVVLACLVGNGMRLLIATETLDWEVPGFQTSDRGSLEWQRALQGQAKRAGIGSGLLTLVLATGFGYAGCHMHRTNKQARPTLES